MCLRDDELQRRAVATTPHHLEATEILELTSKLFLKTKQLTGQISWQTLVNSLGQDPQKHMGQKC